jgi:hypothetical protein
VYQFRSFVDHLQALTKRTSERVGLRVKNNKILLQALLILTLKPTKTKDVPYVSA